MHRALGIAGLCTILVACSASNAPPSASDGGGIVGDGSLGSCVTLGPIGMPRPNCPNDLPPDNDCATATPVYADVAPIFASRCSVCHHSGGYETMYLFDTYDQIYANRGRILTQIYACRMPPSCAPNLSGDERATMLKWLVCGATESRDAGAD